MLTLSVLGTISCFITYIHRTISSSHTYKELFLVSLLHIYTQDGTPMLLIPAQKGFSMVTQYLLENGANPNLTDRVCVYCVHDVTLFAHYAIRQGSVLCK